MKLTKPSRFSIISISTLSLLSALLIPMSAISVNATEPGEGVQRDKEHRVHCTKSKWGIKLCKPQSRLCTQPWSRGTDTKGEVIETRGARNCSDWG
jgi:hypothetical protein